jgi:hypothetical protein
MEQQIRNENFREIEFKKSMFNVKMFSLMKKQLFSLVMMLALVVLAGTSAWAQTGLLVTDPVWHLPGSTHGFQVVDHTDTDYAWAIASVTCAGAAGSGAAQTINAVVGSEHQATVTYTPDASGLYRISVTESSTGDEGCSTIREFFTAIMDINVVVIASDNLGDAVANLTTCNDYSTLNGSALVGNDNADDGSNNLAAFIDPAWYNTRYVEVTLEVADNTGCGLATAPAATDFAWTFDYTIADGASTATNYVDNFRTLTNAGVTFTDATDETSSIQVPQGTTSIVLTMTSNIRWSTDSDAADQSFTFTVDAGSTQLDDDIAPFDYTDGTEPATENGDNVSGLQHIDASPATPRITIND